ncbi:MAG: D-alanyl-D-alanine carboxypeptidase/D-alanyl-D-alanine-endopeptidase, partial [Paludibacteraceae bacterium]|nr:D-alanyl-D-alanine carboxypeptidase/D-alanyl-D-alanine-endopeptidase [Paludibacteraceae bacterium]
MKYVFRYIYVLATCLLVSRAFAAGSIDILLQHPVTATANITLLVQDLHSGEIIDSYRPKNVAPPASVMKLLPTATALETLGADYRFSTYIEYSGTIDGGVLHGDLYVRGTGDPTLGSQKVGDRNLLNRWVRAVREAGIRTIDGRVIADLSYFDADAINPGWIWEDIGNYYAPGIYALSYMDNTMNVILRSGPVGSIAEVQYTVPEVPGVQFDNHIRCTSITHDGAFVHGAAYNYTRYLTGSVPSNKGSFGVQGDLPNPGLLLVQHFTQKLEENGVKVTAEPTYQSEADAVSRTLLYTWQSPPLAEIIMETNVHSNNMYAECLFRTFGSRYSLPCTIHNSADFEKDYWLRRGVDIRSARIVDGCGLAPQDALSAETLVQLLTYMYRSKNSDAFYASLP